MKINNIYVLSMDGVKNRIKPTPSKKLNNRTKTITNYINIYFLKYLNNWFKSIATSGDFYE